MSMWMLAQNNSSGNAAAAAFFGGIMLIFFALYLLLVVAMLVGMWKVFVKAGRPGWEAIVPFYNFYILITKVAIRPWWLFLGILAVFIPFVGPFVMLAVSILISIDVARNFNRGIGFAIGLALLPFVFYPILGFGQDKFEPKPKEILPQLV
jgi:hypothetical protein